MKAKNHIVYFFVCSLTLFISCDKLPFLKKQETQKLDTIVDFTSVDMSPSFKVCDSIIDKSEKSECFRTTIHQKIGEQLKNFSFTSSDSINESIVLDIRINANGIISLDSLKSSKNLQEKLPELDSFLQLSIKGLPKIYPAIKRGIPVTTKYQLPIKIILEE
ncbi:MAG: hypothetical protein HWD82_07490 [Flavobacteriaceae bacterium]|nr:hypothetical protein [Flavobacteriaceae bacterium]